MSKNNQPILRTVQNSLKIIELFNYDTPELSVSEISKKLDLSKSIISRIVFTLTKQSILIKNNKSGKYKLGSLILELGLVASIINPVISNSHLPLIELENTLNINSYIIVPLHFDFITASSSFDIAHKIEIRKKIIQSTLGGTICGLTILAWQDSTFIANAITHTIDKHDKISKTYLQEKINQIRQQGYANYEELLFKGTRTVACPIFKPDGSVLSAVAVTGPHALFTQHNKIIKHVSRTAQKISNRLYK